jgi:hypothetical protein
MKNILVYSRQIQAVKNPIAVSHRNAKILADELGADLLMYKEDKLQQKEYDVIICPYFNRYTDYVTLKSLVRKNQTRWLLRTEYEGVHGIFKEFNPYFEICNFENGTNFLNTNLFIAKKSNPLGIKKYDCIYYSRHRADRMKYCKEYLQGNIYLSTHPKNHKHFFHAGCKPKLIKHIDWTPGKDTLNLFRYSLYLEDIYTHSVFNNLANRWYEAGFCNNVVFFDKNCINTIRKSEIGKYEKEIEYYIVGNHQELEDKIKECNRDFNHHLNIQKSWRKDELKCRQNMIQELKKIIDAK